MTESGDRYFIARRSILLLVIGVGVTVLYIAEHVSGGGYLHPRYVFPVLGSVAILFVIGLDRIAPRILPVAVLVGMATWTLVQLPVGVDPSQSSRPRDEGRLAPTALRTLPGSDCVAIVHCTVDRDRVRHRCSRHRRGGLRSRPHGRRRAHRWFFQPFQ